MMIPDYRLIAEVQLYAAGFQTAGALAAHLVSVLKVVHLLLVLVL
jgi:dynein heavy chain